MNWFVPLPLPLAEAITRTRFSLARFYDMNQRWQWLLLLVVCGLIIAYVAYAYYRDSVELPRGVGFSLLLLRIFAFAGLLFAFMDLEKRTERVLVKNSRAVILVDTSQSMEVRDVEPEGSQTPRTRIGRVIDELGKGELIGTLQKRHDVTVMRFDEGTKPQQIAAFSCTAKSAESESDPRVSLQAQTADMAALRLTLAVGAVAVVLALGLGVLYFAFVGSRVTDFLAWGLFLGVMIALAGFVTAAVGHLRHSNIPFSAAVGLPQWSRDSKSEEEKDESEKTDDAESGEEGKEKLSDTQDSEESPEGDEEKTELDPPQIDWPSLLEAKGRQTRLGDNLADIVQRERGGPLAAVVVFSDGQRNAGIDCEEAVALARDAAIPFHSVGMGSDETPTNVRLVDVQAPPRVFPRDEFPITVYVRGDGLEGRRVEVELSSAEAGSDGDEPSYDLEYSQTLTLGSAGVDEEAGDVVDSIKFSITPEEEGKRLYRVRVEQLEEEADLTDNEKTVPVEVVERKNKVLLLADGPTREYRFLRNMLYRDRAVTTDVCLQSAAAGISQEADTILDEFPMTEAELFDEYDCIVAFDPDWLALDLDQLQLLDRWVAEKAGGLIVIAGAVHTPDWVPKERDDERVKLIKGLYPVVFDRWRFTGGKEMASDVTSPPQFTREGANAEFLWLDDDPVASEGIWADFGGVYGYYNLLSIREAKPGATVYARLPADAKTKIDEEMPPYMVGQYYGAGQVFFLGSGEMWRLRAVDDEYFETFYTKLIRHVSQGRLLRDSSRGILMVGKPRCVLGDTVVVRAQLSDRQYRPLVVPEVEAILVMPDGTRVPFVLKAVKDAPRPGLYSEQFMALVEGDYRIELMLPDSEIGELLTRDVQVRAPKLEIERPQRNDVLLKEIARQTGGEYYVGVDAAMGQLGAPPLSSVIEPNNVSTTLAGTPDTDFQRLLMGWLLAAIAGALTFEWLIRRLSKLA